MKLFGYDESQIEGIKITNDEDFSLHEIPTYIQKVDPSVDINKINVVSILNYGDSLYIWYVIE